MSRFRAWWPPALVAAAATFAIALGEVAALYWFLPHHDAGPVAGFCCVVDALVLAAVLTIGWFVTGAMRR